MHANEPTEDIIVRRNALIARVRAERAADIAWHSVICVATDCGEHEALRRVMRPANVSRRDRLVSALPFASPTLIVVIDAAIVAIDTI